MLYFIFTIDGDWKEYFDLGLPKEQRRPHLDTFIKILQKEIDFARANLNGKFIHFVHTSPRARDFFLHPQLITYWKLIVKKGGSIGIHCHEEDPHKEYFFDDEGRMRQAIEFICKELREKGINPLAYRGGYLAFSPKIIPILEENNIYLDFSCEPGRHLVHNDILVSDWRGAPHNYYPLSYEDHRKPGESKVFEVPLGTDGNNHLYVERSSLSQFENIAQALKRKKEDIIVSVLTHSYEFSSLEKLKKVVAILKKYGRFINAKEALEIIKSR